MTAVAPVHDRAAWLLVAAGLLFVLAFHLVPALLAGLLVHVLLYRLAGRMSGRRLSHGTAKLLALALVGVVAVGAVAGIVLGVVGFVRGRVGELPALFTRMADTLESTRLWLEARGAPGLVPQALRDAEALRGHAVGWLRDHATGLQRMGGEVGRGLLHVAMGTAIGVLAFFGRPAERRAAQPLAEALLERLRRLEAAFEAIVFAQVKISAVNAVLTALFLLVGLRVAGVHLPFAPTLVALTFLLGLLPIVGNVLSNTVIVVIALGVSPWVAVAALIFLVVIHKLEYVVSARIVGGQIQATAWEVLLAMVAFEAAFGLAGLVLAPIAYAYVKRELTDAGLV